MSYVIHDYGNELINYGFATAAEAEAWLANEENADVAGEAPHDIDEACDRHPKIVAEGCGKCDPGPSRSEHDNDPHNIKNWGHE